MDKSTTVTEFGDILQNAMLSKANNEQELVWRTKDGSDIKLMDMSPDELQKAYTHTTDMLYNGNKYTPGRIQVKKNIKTLIGNCNAELLLRYILHECNIDILKTNLQLIDFIRNSKSANNLSDSDSVANLFTSLPVEFETVTIGDLINACFDKLDIINRKMISEKFILAQGIWLTEDEKQELTEYDNSGKMRSWLDVIKDRLFLSDATKLRVDPRGFSYSEFRALAHLEPLAKISKLPSDTLRLLRDKVFILLDADTDYHIQRWETIKENIEKVAKEKGITLNKKVY